MKVKKQFSLFLLVNFLAFKCIWSIESSIRSVWKVFLSRSAEKLVGDLSYTSWEFIQDLSIHIFVLTRNRKAL